MNVELVDAIGCGPVYIRYRQARGFLLQNQNIQHREYVVLYTLAVEYEQVPDTRATLNKCLTLVQF